MMKQGFSTVLRLDIMDSRKDFLWKSNVNIL